MSTSVRDASAAECWSDEENLWIRLKDGRQLSVPLKFYPRLFYASPEARSRVRLTGDGTGLHWPDLDEDISVEGLLLGVGDTTRWGVEERRKLGSL